MTIQKPSAALNITLWIAQVILAATFIWAASMKLFKPVEELSLMWPWVGEVSEGLVKFTGVVDLLGAIGLILPSLLRIRPNLTPVTAMGIIVLMICASGFHIARGEAANIAPNIVFGIIAVFIAWGRLKKAPIAPK